MAVEFAVTVVTGSLAGVGEEPEQKEPQHLIEQLSNNTTEIHTSCGQFVVRSSRRVKTRSHHS